MHGRIPQITGIDVENSCLRLLETCFGKRKALLEQLSRTEQCMNDL